MALICRPRIFDCDTVTFPMNSYIKKDRSQSSSDSEDILDSYILTDYPNKLITIRSDLDSVFMLPNDELVVCHDTVIEALHQANLPTLSEMMYSWIGLLSSIISCVASCLTLAMYICIRRSKHFGSPDILLASYVFSVLMAQLAYIVEVTSLGRDKTIFNCQILRWVVCRLTACCLHFGWLSSAVWSSVIAFDIFETFRDGSRAVRRKGRGKRYPFYICLAWVLPLIFVLVLAFIYGQKIYGNNICFIVESYVQIVFVAPLAVSLLLNASLFVCTVYYLRISAVSRSTGISVISISVRKEISVCLKISTLHGFTWAFGFLALIFKNNWLWYIFSLANSLQGVFIFIAFVCNNGSLKMLRQGLKQNKYLDKIKSNFLYNITFKKSNISSINNSSNESQNVYSI